MKLLQNVATLIAAFEKAAGKSDILHHNKVLKKSDKLWSRWLELKLHDSDDS